MNRLESIKERFNQYDFVHSYIDDNSCNQEWNEAHEAVGYLLQRLEIAQKALEEELKDAKTWENRGTIKRIESALDQLKE